MPVKMALIPDNFPDQIWVALKAWARSIAQDAVTPGDDACRIEVERIAREITGVPNILRPDVVAFYAVETAEMIAKFRSEHTLAADGSPGEIIQDG